MTTKRRRLFETAKNLAETACDQYRHFQDESYKTVFVQNNQDGLTISQTNLCEPYEEIPEETLMDWLLKNLPNYIKATSLLSMYVCGDNGQISFEIVSELEIEETKNSSNQKMPLESNPKIILYIDFD